MKLQNCSFYVCDLDLKKKKGLWWFSLLFWVNSRSLAKSTKMYGDMTPLSHNVTYVQAAPLFEGLC